MNKNFLKNIYLFYFFASSYVVIEVFFRGHSHWTMFILGGICGLLIGKINEYVSWEFPLIFQGIIGSIIVTLAELFFGYILNIQLKLNIWDYSNIPFNFYGQICLLFSTIWGFLSIIVIILDDYLRYLFFNEEKPRYILF